MGVEEIEEIQGLTTSLIVFSKVISRVVGNVSHKTGDGSMYALG